MQTNMHCGLTYVQGIQTDTVRPVLSMLAATVWGALCQIKTSRSDLSKLKKLVCPNPATEEA